MVSQRADHLYNSITCAFGLQDYSIPITHYIIMYTGRITTLQK